MKRSKWVLFLLLACASIGLAAERKDSTQVDTNALIKETQRTGIIQNANGGQGMHFVWYLPVEFWQASLLQNQQVTKAQADAILDQMKGITIVAVMRSEIKLGGAAAYYGEDAVHKKLTLQYTGADGKVVTLKEKSVLSPASAGILASMKPTLMASMGKLGENMHFFVFDDLGADGKRIVSPDVPGKLIANLELLEADPGGKIEFEFPLNSLFKPRACAQCNHGDMNILWKFCPHCGAKLTE